MFSRILLVPVLLFSTLAFSAGPTLRPLLAIEKPTRVATGQVVFKADTAPDVDLRTKILAMRLWVRDQGARGTCSVHAITFLIEYSLIDQLQANTGNELSEEFLNWASNQVTASAADGDFFGNLDAGFKKYGIPMEGDMPYASAFYPSYEPSETAKANALRTLRLTTINLRANDGTYGVNQWTIDAAQRVLRSGMPLAIGLRWNSGTPTDVIQGVPVLRTIGVNDATAGHSVVLVGFKQSALFPGGGYFIYRNSWGEAAGDHGYGYLTFDYVMRNTADILYYN